MSHRDIPTLQDPIIYGLFVGAVPSPIFGALFSFFILGRHDYFSMIVTGIIFAIIAGFGVFFISKHLSSAERSEGVGGAMIP